MPSLAAFDQSQLEKIELHKSMRKTGTADLSNATNTRKQTVILSMSKRCHTSPTTVQNDVSTHVHVAPSESGIAIEAMVPRVNMNWVELHHL